MMMSENGREKIMAAARLTAQAHGYNGLNFREIGAAAGMKHVSIYHHFPSKADLGAAVARRYWEDTAQRLDELATSSGDARKALLAYPALFRASLKAENRMCLAGFMAAEYDDLPEAVKVEVQAFADVNVAWLARMLAEAGVPKAAVDAKARAIFAAVGGAQLMARGHADLALFDSLIDSFVEAGLIPT
jgi:TetR/AcrR family transcriptional repressor of nem operon